MNGSRFNPVAPPIRTPIAGADGAPAKPWVMFFQQLFEIILARQTVQDKPVATAMGADSITPDAANVTTQIILDRAATYITKPAFEGQFVRLPIGLRFRLKFLHSVADSGLVWDVAWVGVEDQVSGVVGEYSSWEFEVRPDGRPELVNVPLIGGFDNP